MSDEFPEVSHHRGPYQLVNVEELEREIDEAYLRIEYLVELQATYRRCGNDVEVTRLGGKIEGYKEMRSKAIEAVRRAAGGVR